MSHSRLDGPEDAVAYSCPFLAALLAGVAVFAREKRRSRIERQLFWGSAVMLGAGQAGYLLSKGIPLAATGTFVEAGFVVMALTLAYDLRAARHGQHQPLLRIAVWLAVAASPFVVFGYDTTAREATSGQAPMMCEITAKMSTATVMPDKTSVNLAMMVSGRDGSGTLPSGFPETHVVLF